MGEHPPTGCRAKPPAQQGLPSATLQCVAPPNFSPLPMETLVGFAAVLPTDSGIPRNTLYVLRAGSLLGPAWAPPAVAPRRSLPRQAGAAPAVSVTLWRLHHVGGTTRVEMWGGKSIVLALARRVSAGLRDVSPLGTGCWEVCQQPAQLWDSSPEGSESLGRVSAPAVREAQTLKVFGWCRTQPAWRSPGEGTALALQGPKNTWGLQKIHGMSQPSAQGWVSAGPDSGESCRAQQGCARPWDWSG